MGDVLRKLALVLSLAAIALPAAAFDGPPQKGAAKKSAAQQEQPSDAADDKSKTAAMVQQAFDGGIKAYGAGKYEEALRAFEAAMRGGLPGEQMPRALYYRGLTFRKLGKPGFAISDLTSALWLKGGLSEAERADAVKARALAYNESGVDSVPAVPQSSYAQAPAMPGKNNDAPMAMAEWRRRACCGLQCAGGSDAASKLRWHRRLLLRAVRWRVIERTDARTRQGSGVQHGIDRPSPPANGG